MGDGASVDWRRAASMLMCGPFRSELSGAARRRGAWLRSLGERLWQFLPKPQSTISC